MTTFHITKFEGTQEELVQLMAERFKDFRITSAHIQLELISDPDFGLKNEVIGMVAKDGMITAIKRVREVKGWHLKDAKDWVESVTGRSVSSP